MSTIFISHSSADNELAKELVNWLKTHGHGSVFLDLDRDDGIKSGEKWGTNLKYFLMTLEQFMKWYEDGAKGNPHCWDKTAVLDPMEIQIEHIYPQNALEKDDALELLKHSLGNLSFWGPDYNNDASNKKFSDKKELYATSNIRLNRNLAQLNQWNVESLKIRENKLIQYAEAIFKLM